MKCIRKQTSRSRNWLFMALGWYVVILFAGSVTSPTTAYYRDEKQVNDRMTIGTWESDQQQKKAEEPIEESLATEHEQNHNQPEENSAAKENDTESNKLIEMDETETEIDQDTESTQTEATDAAKEEPTIENEVIVPSKNEEEGEKVENEEAGNVD
ncbi:hypothetical protein [Bacillus sp. SA1-12]|uniref:hypothetical protein n=1 Tax=Bacillus sp. SA1-12 TaxID=1455638 RepID=UPI000B1515B5|nr:hypothetical protein [Bacillus sp. SA1-12]